MDEYTDQAMEWTDHLQRSGSWPLFWPQCWPQDLFIRSPNNLPSHEKLTFIRNCIFSRFVYIKTICNLFCSSPITVRRKHPCMAVKTRCNGKTSEPGSKFRCGRAGRGVQPLFTPQLPVKPLPPTLHYGMTDQRDGLTVKAYFRVAYPQLKMVQNSVF